MALLAFALAPAALAQGTHIYTCTDAKGKRITGDRPIPECLDREQKELNASGSVRRSIGPELTAAERAAADERRKREQEEAARVADEKRRTRALLARYPDRATHDRERASALRSVEDVAAAATKRVAELDKQRGKLLAETEFYKGDMSKVPDKLKRALDENAQNAAAQKRFIDNQEEEKRRVNARFDAELKRLETLWAAPMAAASASASPARTTRD